MFYRNIMQIGGSGGLLPAVVRNFATGLFSCQIPPTWLVSGCVGVITQKWQSLRVNSSSNFLEKLTQRGRVWGGGGQFFVRQLLFDSLSPNIVIQILLIRHHDWENLFKHQNSSSLVIICLILMTWMCCNATDAMGRSLMLITLGA